MSLSFLATLAWLAQAGPTREPALPRPFALVVERRRGAADCPDGPGLTAAVGAIVQSDGAQGGAGGEPIRMAVTFSRDTAAYRAELLLEGPREGGRTLADPSTSCTALGRAVAIALALWLDASKQEAAAAPPASAAVPAPVSPGAATFSAPAPATGATSGFLALRAGPAWGYVGDGSASRRAFSGGLELGLRVGARLTVALGAEHVLARPTALPPGEVAVSLTAARLAGCAAFNAPPAAVQVAGCALGRAGALHGEGRGFASSNAATVAFWSAGAELRAETLLRGRWLLALAADVEAPLRSYTFSVAEVGQVNGAAGWMAQVLLGLGARLW